MTPPAPPAGFRWRSRGLLLAAGGVAYLVAAIALKDSVLILIATPLLVAPLATALLAPRPAPRAELTWEEVGPWDQVRIEGSVRGRPAAAMHDVTVALESPPDLPERPFRRVEHRAGEMRFEMRWNSPYPSVEIVPPPEVAWRDPIGLVERPVEVEGRELVAERYPLDLFRRGAVRFERSWPISGATRAHQAGTSGEFYEIRPAAPSESPRRINWWASARRGRWLANDFELERKVDVIVLVDTRPTELGEVADERFLAVARAAATSISLTFLTEKARVGYARFGEFLEAVPLSGGRMHGLRIREAIRTTRRSPVDSPSERCAYSLRRFYPPRVTTVLLSSLAGEDAFDLVAFLRRRGYPVIVLNPTWRSLLPRRTTLPPREDALAARLSHLERRMVLRATRTQATVVDWEDFSNLRDFAFWIQHPNVRRA